MPDRGAVVDYKTVPSDYTEVVTRLEQEKERLERERWIPSLPKPRRRVKRQAVTKPRSKAVFSDVGKFMKHGRWSKYYRRTVKEKVNMEEED